MLKLPQPKIKPPRPASVRSIRTGADRFGTPSSSPNNPLHTIMSFIHRSTAFLLPCLLLGGCATAPLIIDPQHPANSSANESARSHEIRMLTPDTDTRRTQQLLDEREKQTRQSEAEPITTPPSPAPANQPKMDHSTMDH